MDTITALATAPGIGGIAVIRVSGDESFSIVQSIFSSSKSIVDLPSHSILYGKINDGERLIDTVLVSIFKSPNSYTGEDVIEISCHGGMLVADEIISVLQKAGARLAEPGEFTKRAFLNGKLDLTQVEAVADLIHSSSVQGTQTSARQLAGEFKARLSNVRKQLIDSAGLLELELDFSDEDIELIERKQVEEKLEAVKNFCLQLSESFKSAEILRSGYFVGIAGYPNAGKSRLFNSLIKKKRAIVSEIPGTTRDYIEEDIMLGGIAVRIIDTAGIRDTNDVIEIQGIEFVESVLEQSNMILVLNDLSISATHSDELYTEIKSKYSDSELVLVQNKIDLTNYSNENNDGFYISAKYEHGIEGLTEYIEKRAKSNTEREKDILINQRQANLLTQAAMNIDSALESLNNEAENELIAIDIRAAGKNLGELSGESWSEEVLNNIFAGFCIGK